MAERDIETLLGGYATGTLTEAERRQLFEVAMHDQELFDALTDEQALKEILDDPQCRQRILRALQARERNAAGHTLGSVLQWLRRPTNLATVGGLAAGFLAVWMLIAVQEEATLAPREGDHVTRALETKEDAEPGPVPEAARDSLASSDVAAEKARADRARSQKSAPSDHLASRASPATPAPRAGRKRDMQPAPVPSMTPSLAGSEAQPGWLTSHHRPLKAGPARQWYYARLEPVPMKKSRVHPEALQDTRTEEAASTPPPQVGLERAQTAGVVKPLGLRYSVLIEREDGEFTETSPGGPFRSDDAVQLALEVNEPGYLYVFRLGPRGTWTWLFPAGPVGQGNKQPGASVISGRRYVLPETGVLRLSGEPAANRMIVIFSRTPRRELQVFDPAALERQKAKDRPAADLKSLLSRARIEASTRPLFIEQVELDRTDAAQERAVYIVNPEAGQDAAIAVELTFPSG